MVKSFPLLRLDSTRPKTRDLEGSKPRATDPYRFYVLRLIRMHSCRCHHIEF